MPIGDKDNKTDSAKAAFVSFSNGVKTNRNAWAYNFDVTALQSNMMSMIDFYNNQIGLKDPSADSKKISWDGTLLSDFRKSKKGHFDPTAIRRASFRPFINTNVYFSRMFNNSVYQIPKYFPNPDSENIVITFNQLSSKPFAAFVTRTIPDHDLNEHGQCFPLYVYSDDSDEASLFESQGGRQSGISSYALREFRKRFGEKITQEEIFFYVYGILWNPWYLKAYASNLRKELPRIPFSRNFAEIAKLGRKLADLHLNFETCDEYELEVLSGDNEDISKLKVRKMSWDNKSKVPTLLINAELRVTGFPDYLSEMLVNGRNPIDWMIDRFQVKTDPESGLLNDPNPEIDLMGGIIASLKRVSFVVDETGKLMNKMPAIEEID
jgi:predicted helicase